MADRGNPTASVRRFHGGESTLAPTPAPAPADPAQVAPQLRFAGTCGPTDFGKSADHAAVHTRPWSLRNPRSPTRDCEIELRFGTTRNDDGAVSFRRGGSGPGGPDAEFGQTRTNLKETPMSVPLSLRVNGKPVTADVAPDTLLVTLLREHLRLTGTHVGCDTAQCGACTVHVDGRAVKSCNVLAAQLQGADVTTIEGISPVDGSMHPMQVAFKTCHGLQCGFCTPGMVMSAIDLVKHHPHGTDREIREGLEGNLCRCTGYQNIAKAVAQGAAAMGV
jgi:carbon-monoxide dehydrogenase small subunit